MQTKKILLPLLLAGFLLTNLPVHAATTPEQTATPEEAVTVATVNIYVNKITVTDKNKLKIN